MSQRCNKIIFTHWYSQVMHPSTSAECIIEAFYFKNEVYVLNKAQINCPFLVTHSWNIFNVPIWGLEDQKVTSAQWWRVRRFECGPAWGRQTSHLRTGDKERHQLLDYLQVSSSRMAARISFKFCISNEQRLLTRHTRWTVSSIPWGLSHVSIW